MKVYLVILHYENRDEFEVHNEIRVAKTYNKALEIFEEMKKQELVNSWIADFDLNTVDYYENSKGTFIVDNLIQADLYTSINIIPYEVEE